MKSVCSKLRAIDHQCLLALQRRLFSRPLVLVETALIEKRSPFSSIAYRFAALLLILGDSAFGIARDLFWVALAPVCRMLTGVMISLQLLRSHKLKLAGVNLCQIVLSFVFAILGWVVDLALRIVRTLIDLLDSIFFSRIQRSLTADERGVLETLFGSSLCYPLVRISYGCPSLRLMTPHVAGNVMYLPERAYLLDSTGELNAGARSLLFHEATHVWQHHNGGGSYMHRALAAQLVGSLLKGGRGYAYDWRRGLRDGVAFELLNPEQQAQLAQDIGNRLSPGSQQLFCFENQLEQRYAERALICLQSGRSQFWGTSAF